MSRVPSRWKALRALALVVVGLGVVQVVTPGRVLGAGPMPALGTYTYAVDGEEGASVMGTRRFPDRMTMVVHKGEGLGADELVFDYTYSDQHYERQIVGYRGDGVYFDYEAGSITFGPRTETSEADYEPAILQVPLPLEPGQSRSGTSEARDQGGGVTRTEDWTVTVVGPEPVEAAGASIEAWKVEVDRRTRPGSSENVVRHRTYWYDPGRSIWVKFVDTMHGERQAGGFTFTYDSNLTATLLSFAPS